MDDILSRDIGYANYFCRIRRRHNASRSRTLCMPYESRKGKGRGDRPWEILETTEPSSSLPFGLVVAVQPVEVRLGLPEGNDDEVQSVVECHGL